ncbi:MAG TPA: NADH:flavin oxidoreductase [Thermoanaerobacterales bacterium]|nr:NADH:flavin oxidoreductase [Thermoanaerobacterales bacterium]
MATFERFNFKTIDEIRDKVKKLGVNISFADDLSPLAKPVKIGNVVSPNSIAVLPMEGCDSERDGSPSELVRRRYRRFAAGGAGLLWFEACAVVHEGRANPLQMYLIEKNVGAFEKLLKEVDEEAKKHNGSDHRPVKVLQLTHSGRYSRPDDKPAPIIAQHDPMLDPRVGISPDDPVVTDEYLDALIEKYVKSAKLAREAGFDGVDIKACHRYLVSELLASHTREGRYGGSFENRMRFLLDTIKAVRSEVGDDFIIASRFNVFDAHPYPYGFGVDKEDFWKPDLTEPLALVKLMVENGVNLLSNSAGNPYYRFPQVTRPFDTPTIGGEIPEEHPLESVARLFELTRQIQKAAGNIPVVGNGYSWLRQFLPNAGAANIADGSCTLVGIGRQAFAYPDAPKDMLEKGAMDPKKSCIACSKCTQIMRDHGRTGCVIRDSEVYLPLYNEARNNATKK